MRPNTRHLHLDPVGGIAGDMFLAALIDLGCPLSIITQGLAHVQTQFPWHASVVRVERHMIGALRLKVDVAEASCLRQPHEGEHMHEHSHAHADGHSHAHSHGGKMPPLHQHTRAQEVLAMAQSLTGPPRIRERAAAIVRVLAQAEARVHGMNEADVHFHEVGAVDSIVDMLGAAIALEYLGIDTLSCGPLPVGTGFVKCAHGQMPLPAPAAAYLLEGCPTRGVDFHKETITPTGAAIVKALCTSFGPMPDMRITGSGYGAGTRDDAYAPNLLRVMRGERD